MLPSEDARLCGVLQLVSAAAARCGESALSTYGLEEARRVDAGCQAWKGWLWYQPEG